MLQEEGYDVVTASNGREGLRTFFTLRPALVVLDILMPEMNGWELLERIREVSESPVIILTALGREQDAVKGLRSGADDYVVKPVRTSEFVARVEAALRKSSPTPEVENVYKDAVLHVDYMRHQVYLRGSEVALSAQEFRLLAALVRNASAVVSTDRLLDMCWGDAGGPESVRVYIGYLRKKLEEDSKRPRLIQTVREFGYRYSQPSE